MSKRSQLPAAGSNSDQPFRFGFGSLPSDAPSEASEPLPLQEESAIAEPSPGRYAVLTTGVGGSTWGSTSSISHIPAGAIVRVHWDHTESAGQHLYVSRHGKGAGVVPVTALRLLPTAKDACTQTILTGNDDSPLLRQIDTLFPNVTSLPLVIEPGLDSLIWPVTARQFMNEHWGRKALCVHASANRLASLSSDFSRLRVADMIASSSRLVVWMKDKDKGKVNYLDAGPEVGAACWKAGHSLYFNPPTEVQSKWIGALASELGMDFATDLSGGGCVQEQDGTGEKGPGGDIEVFAVRGKHSTHWHFDAQENFTLQLRGTKRWSVCPSGLADPLTNLHPASAGSASLHNDAKMHLACDSSIQGCLPPPLLAPGSPPAAGHPSIRTVLLRPGSFLYVPSGWWHAVQAEDEGEEEQDSGSLSCNFSMVGSRWIEFLVRRIVPHIASADSRWRGRMLPANGAGGGSRDARAHLSSMLQALPGILSHLQADDFLPDGIFLGNRASRVTLLPPGQGAGRGGQAGGSEGGTRKRRRVADGVDAEDAARALAAYEEEVEAGREVGECSTGPACERASLVHRRPLSVLVVEGEPSGDITRVTLPGAGSDTRFVRCTVHSGFGTASGEPAASDFSVTITCSEELLPALVLLSRLPPCTDMSLGTLALMLQERAGTGLRGDLVSLVRVLIHNGYLGHGARAGAE